MSNLDWKNLSFGYLQTNVNARSYWRNEKWEDVELTSSEYINLHMAATCLHYGQEIFEGLKAFRGKDNKVRIFRWQENAKRFRNSASYLMMKEVPDNIFKDAVFKTVKGNEEFIPPYGTGATLYIRPLLIGSGPEVGVKPSKEYLFLVFVTPVGPYFKEGFKPVNIMISNNFDRCAPLGTGHIKAGGNYAASLLSIEEAHKNCFTTALYLDSKEKKYIDECGQVNFFGIKNNTYVTPSSRSVLPSITNLSLQQLAIDMGMKVEKRPIPIEELETFEEVGGCGTAAVIMPIRKIVDLDKNKIIEYCKDGSPGPISTKLFNRLTAIQLGEEQDIYGWTEIVQ